MNLSAPSIWHRSYMVLAVVAFLLFLLHVGDDVSRGEIPLGSAQVAGLVNVVGGVLYVFGLLWSQLYRRYGYLVVVVVNVLTAGAGGSLFHVFAIAGAHSLEEMATKAGAWAPVMVATSLLVGVAAWSTIILGIYLLAKPSKARV